MLQTEDVESLAVAFLSMNFGYVFFTYHASDYLHLCGNNPWTVGQLLLRHNHYIHEEIAFIWIREWKSMKINEQVHLIRKELVARSIEAIRMA